MKERRLLKGRYELKGMLGEGGLAWVYAAKCHHTGDTVAVKILRPEAIRSYPEVVDRFSREADILKKLRHPHIVRFYDQGQEHGLHFIVLEYVYGLTLRQQIDEHGSLPLRQALQMARQVASALSFAEQMGVVHRDIKPPNIIVDYYDWAKVMDFGIARDYHISTMTSMGAILGTIQYLSPEQARGERVDISTDIYALGATLHEALSGKPLFVGENPTTIIHKILNEPPPRLAPGGEVERGASQAVNALLQRCLAKDRSQRYRSARQLVAVLDEVISGLKEDRAEADSPLDTLLAHVASGRRSPLAIEEEATRPARRVEPQSFYERSVAGRAPFKGGGAGETASRGRSNQPSSPSGRAAASPAAAASGRASEIRKENAATGRKDGQRSILPGMNRWRLAIGGLAGLVAIAALSLGAVAVVGGGLMTGRFVTPSRQATATAPGAKAWTTATSTPLPTSTLAPSAVAASPTPVPSSPTPKSAVATVTPVVTTVQTTPSPKPSDTPATAAPATVPTYSAPILLEPENGLSRSAANDVITLRWSLAGGLQGEKDYFFVHIRVIDNPQLSVPHYTRDTSYQVPTHIFDRSSKFEWSVITWRQTGSEPKVGAPAGAQSETRTFFWKGTEPPGTIDAKCPPGSPRC